MACQASALAVRAAASASRCCRLVAGRDRVALIITSVDYVAWLPSDVARITVSGAEEATGVMTKVVPADLADSSVFEGVEKAIKDLDVSS